MTKIIVEYIWLDGHSELRSKARTINVDFKKTICINDIPNWNYDGSSTLQAFDSNTEIILKPRALYKCPFRRNNNMLVMCDTYDTLNVPLDNNYRVNANNIFNKKLEEEPWYGIEQEFFIIDNDTFEPIDISVPNKYGGKLSKNQIGMHYCGLGLNYKSRQLIDEHYEACLYAGLDISGINAEVAVGQWEYQIGPTKGIGAGDQVWVSRYILQRIGEKYNVSIDFTPKPIKGNTNGSGCHTNYSTKSMREEGGLKIINEAIDKLSIKHVEHMKFYGKDNHLRMTGLNETSSYDTFSYGVGTRDSSIRIPTETVKNKCGYFEDRRPSSNMDPYLVTSTLFDATILN